MDRFGFFCSVALPCVNRPLLLLGAIANPDFTHFRSGRTDRPLFQ